MDFACLRFIGLRMQCALMMVILKISDLSLAIYIVRCFSYGSCSSPIVSTSYPSLHTI
ncbi:hypothetical protein Hanom_Chr17g01562471 [Helianthus anomalus]